jgi:hypothetical protein
MAWLPPFVLVVPPEPMGPGSSVPLHAKTASELKNVTVSGRLERNEVMGYSKVRRLSAVGPGFFWQKRAGKCSPPRDLQSAERVRSLN